MNRRSFLSGATAGAAICSGIVLFQTLTSGEESDSSDQFEDPSLEWQTHQDMAGYCAVRLDAENSTLGDADAVIVADGSIEHRWDGGKRSWSFTVKGPQETAHEYGGQIRAWAVRGDWRKHLFVGRVNGDCELVDDPYDESLE